MDAQIELRKPTENAGCEQKDAQQEGKQEQRQKVQFYQPKIR